jgi:hypothetical protein
MLAHLWRQPSFTPQERTHTDVSVIGIVSPISFPRTKSAAPYRPFHTVGIFLVPRSATSHEKSALIVALGRNRSHAQALG